MFKFLRKKDKHSTLKLDDNIVIGTFENRKVNVENFNIDINFKNRFHLLIATHGQDILSLKQAAKKQKDGYVYIIDHRTPERIMGNVPAEDIIGAFKVINSEIVPDTYQPNENYKFYTINGKPQLPEELINMLCKKY